MKKVKLTLSNQLLIIISIIFLIIILSLSIILPRLLVPIYEKTLYTNLSQPLNFIRNDIDENNIDSEIAYVFIESNNDILFSKNILNVIDISGFSDISNKIIGLEGKFKYDGKYYYYSSLNGPHSYVIAITNSNYIKEMKSDFLWSILPLMIVTIGLSIVILVLWINLVVTRIKKINKKIDDIGKDANKEEVLDKIILIDELNDLNGTIDNVKEVLIKQEQYRNELYQNISHDFKTPITVIKSYIEAGKDGVEENDKVLKIIDKQVKLLEDKIKMLLNLNKLDYLKYNKEKYDNINIVDIINNSVEKFKYKKKKLEWIITTEKNEINYLGTIELWESIIDNILSNFIRYAKDVIEIKVTEKDITLFNDGEKIEDNLLENIFTPYKKGVKGEFGLGLSIVKKSLDLLNYNISIKNKEDGVEFKISKR